MPYRKKKRDKNGKMIPYGKYLIKFMDHLGIERRITGFSDLKATNEFQRNILRLVSLRQSGGLPDSSLNGFIDACPPNKLESLVKWGIIEPARLASNKPLLDHARAWQSHLEASQCSLRHCKQVLARVKKVAEECCFVFASDVNAETVEDWLMQCRQKGMSTRTSNSYLATLKACLKWMIGAGYIVDNPLSRLKKLNEKLDVRLKRRALTEEEARRLVGITNRSPRKLYGMSGSERSMIYQFAMRTGVRWTEMKCLVRSNFNLDKDSPSVTIPANVAKNKKASVLPLVPEVVHVIKSYFKTHPASPDTEAFPMPKSDKGGIIIKFDLREAGIDFYDEQGQKIDFHSLRHTFITDLARAGIHPKVAQDLARHSSIDLTMNYYTHTSYDDKLSALCKLPPTTSIPDEVKTPIAMGT